jgi:hypothetical protein
VGEITNRGWELQGSFRRGGWSLSSAFTQVDSRVRQLASGYTGDLQPGDRMLEVPAHTLNIGAAWNTARWQASLTGYRAWSWINYDRLAIAEAFAGTTRPPYGFIGANLRTYWKTYPGVTHLNGTLTYTLRRRFALTFTAANLLDSQTGEPDNITVLPGRTLSFGFKTTF